MPIRNYAGPSPYCPYRTLPVNHPGDTVQLMLWERFLEVISALNEKEVDYLVVGAVALGLHGHPRGTRDLDLFVRPTADNVARLQEALRAVWADPSIDEITAEDLCGAYPALAYGPPDDSLPMDILTRLGEAFTFNDLEMTVVEVDGVSVRVATPETLHRMKKDTVRAQDHADAQWLKERYDLEDDE